MRVLLIGGGGRENAVADAVKRSSDKPSLFAVMSRQNPGIAALCDDFLIGDEKDAQAIAAYATEKKIDIAFVGPEAPLSAGVSDALWAAGIPTVGPVKTNARIETDKAWARNFMKKHNIEGNPAYGVFTDADEACAYIEKLGDVAVKPAGLTGGKGVKVMGDQLPDIEAAKEYAREVLKSDSVVIEERFIGEEFTLQAFVDGKNLAFCPTAQDHKRAYEGDVGPNTGGMGSYTNAGALLPFLNPAEYRKAQEIMKQTVAAIAEETGVPYKGILYGQFILTAKGPKVIEYNARFGDPEAMNVLSLLETDLTKIMKAVVDGTLDMTDVRFSEAATVCKYAVPEGYPDAPVKDAEVILSDRLRSASGLKIYYSSVYEKDGHVYTTGSRAIGVVGFGRTIDEAEKKAQMVLDTEIEGRLFFRRDIGTKALVQKRIDHMKELRGAKHLLSMADLTREDIESLLDIAEMIKENRKCGVTPDYLKNKSLAMIFEKSSTRTRNSFEVGMTDMGGHGIYLNANDIQIGRGETVEDTARVLSSYVAAIIARVYSHETVRLLAENSSVPVINALSDEEHPTQIIADLLTIRECKGKISGMKFVWVGDGNNVCNSLMIACALVGMEMVVACPKGYEPKDSYVRKAESLGGKITITDNVTEAAKGADILYTDVWVSMGDEAETEKRLKDLAGYQINEDLIAVADPDVLVMHCLPAHRGLEISAGALEGPHSVVFQEAENRLHAHKAIILKLLGIF